MQDQNFYSSILGQFDNDIKDAGLHISRDLINRFIASILTKKFTIFSGSSGTGKTRLAQIFARWLTPKYIGRSDPFSIGTEIPAQNISYYVSNSDKISVELVNNFDQNKAIFAILPRSLIQEWVNCIKENKFTFSTSARTIREEITKTSKYSPQLNSFETHLRAAAIAVIKNSENTKNLNCVEIIPVGADWTSTEQILGFPDALDPTIYRKTRALELVLQAIDYPDIPHFLILDEMNMSYVERYFSDILSAMESGEEIELYNITDNKRSNVPHKIKLPENLFIIGTINVDETTYQFSPKVLDRANVIEFQSNIKDIEKLLINPRALQISNIDGKGNTFSTEFLARHRIFPTANDIYTQIIKEEIISLVKICSALRCDIGFRTTLDIYKFALYFQNINKDIISENTIISKAIDAQICQKILPRMNGSREGIGGLLHALAYWCSVDHSRDSSLALSSHSLFLEEIVKKAIKIGQEQNSEQNINNTNHESLNSGSFVMSSIKINRMLRQLTLNGFVSFTEA